MPGEPIAFGRQLEAAGVRHARRPIGVADKTRDIPTHQQITRNLLLLRSYITHTHIQLVRIIKTAKNKDGLWLAAGGGSTTVLILSICAIPAVNGWATAPGEAGALWQGAGDVHGSLYAVR